MRTVSIALGLVAAALAASLADMPAYPGKEVAITALTLRGQMAKNGHF